MIKSNKVKKIGILLLFAAGYAFVGIAFPNPSSPGKLQQMWRLTAWITIGVLFVIQIVYETLILNNPTRKIALHAAAASALGAFALAVSANIHSLHVSTVNHSLLAASLIIWPVMTGIPVFLAALAAAYILRKIRPKNKS